MNQAKQSQTKVMRASARALAGLRRPADWPAPDPRSRFGTKANPSPARAARIPSPVEIALNHQANGKPRHAYLPATKAEALRTLAAMETQSLMIRAQAEAHLKWIANIRAQVEAVDDWVVENARAQRRAIDEEIEAMQAYEDENPNRHDG